MKKLFTSFLFLILSFPAVAQQAPAKTSKPAVGLPPIIDRELFFGNPEIAGAQISPDGKYISFVKPWKDTRNIYVKRRRRAIHCRTPAYHRDQAPHRRLFLDPRRQVHRLRQRQRRRRELTTSLPSIPQPNRRPGPTRLRRAT